MKKNFTCSVPI